MKNWQRIARMSLPCCCWPSGWRRAGDSDATTSSGDASAAAASAPEPLTTPPTKINVTTPLAEPPAAGKTFFWLQCELPICEKIGGGVEAAVEGGRLELQERWSSSPPTPAAGIESAVQQNPDAIGITGIPSAAIKSQLKAAADAGIPVVTCSPGPGAAVGGDVRRDLQPDHRTRRREPRQVGDQGLRRRRQHRHGDDPELPLAADHGRRRERHDEEVLPGLLDRRAGPDGRRPGRWPGRLEARRLPAVEP